MTGTYAENGPRAGAGSPASADHPDLRAAGAGVRVVDRRVAGAEVAAALPGTPVPPEAVAVRAAGRPGRGDGVRVWLDAVHRPGARLGAGRCRAPGPRGAGGHAARGLLAGPGGAVPRGRAGLRPDGRRVRLG